MKKTLLVVVVAVLVLSLAFTGCSRGKPSGMIEDKYVTIGGCVPLTGPVAYWGISTMQGWVDGAEVINARGGLKVGDETYKLRIRTYDSKGVTADARAATIRLIEQDKVNFIFNQAAAGTIGMLEVSEPAKVLSSVACWGYLEHYGKDFPFHFRSEMSDYEQGFAYVPYMKEKYPFIKTAAFIGPDDKDGYDCYYSYQRLMSYYSIEDKGVEYFQWEDTDFYPIVTKVIAMNPDCIITSPTPPGITASIIKAAREMGYTGPISSPGASETITIAEVCGEYADDVILPVTLEEPVTDYQKDLKERFIQRFGQFNALSGNYSWWVYALAQAMVDSGSVDDTTKVADALEDVVLEDTYVGKATYGGLGAYGIKRQGIYDCYTTVFEDGEAYLADVRFPALPPGY